MSTGKKALKTSPKKVFLKVAEARGKFLRNKIDGKIMKSAEEIIAPPEKTEEISNGLRQVLSKWNIMKYLNY